MGDGGSVVRLALLLAYGPLVVMVGIWLGALVLVLLRRPAFYHWLCRRTAVPSSEEPH